MKKMTKKAFVVLLISTIAFLVSLMLFYATAPNFKPGQQTKYLGETEINIYKTYQEAEVVLFYIERSAIESARKAETSTNFEQDFKKYFDEYMVQMPKFLNVGFSANDYAITYKEGILKGITTKKITIKQENIEYSFIPNFKVGV